MRSFTAEPHRTGPALSAFWRGAERRDYVYTRVNWLIRQNGKGVLRNLIEGETNDEKHEEATAATEVHGGAVVRVHDHVHVQRV